MTPLEELLITRMPLEELPGILAMLPALAEDTTRLRLPSVYDKRTYVSCEEYLQLRLEGGGLEELEALRAEHCAEAKRVRDLETLLMKQKYDIALAQAMSNSQVSKVYQGAIGLDEESYLRLLYDKHMMEKAQYQR